jgi:hypothetical protein
MSRKLLYNEQRTLGPNYDITSLCLVSWILSCSVYRQTMSTPAAFGSFVLLCVCSLLIKLREIAKTVAHVSQNAEEFKRIVRIETVYWVVDYMAPYVLIWMVMMLIKYMMSLPVEVDWVMPFFALFPVFMLFLSDKKINADLNVVSLRLFR